VIASCTGTFTVYVPSLTLTVVVPAVTPACTLYCVFETFDTVAMFAFALATLKLPEKPGSVTVIERACPAAEKESNGGETLSVPTVTELLGVGNGVGDGVGDGDGGAVGAGVAVGAAVGVTFDEPLGRTVGSEVLPLGPPPAQPLRIAPLISKAKQTRLMES
jgi:hypothetical protein